MRYTLVIDGAEYPGQEDDSSEVAVREEFAELMRGGCVTQISTGHLVNWAHVTVVGIVPAE